MPNKPRVLTRCVANTHTNDDERIVEFSFPGRPSKTGLGNIGGLICFSVTSPDRPPMVSIYHTDTEVRCTVPEDQPPHSDGSRYESRIDLMNIIGAQEAEIRKKDAELYRLRAVASAARNLLMEIDGGQRFDSGPLYRALDALEE